MGFLRDLVTAAGDRQARQPIPDTAHGIAPRSAWVSHDLESLDVSASVLAMWGDTVDRHSAMAVSAIAKGRHLITGSIGKFPMVALAGQSPAPVQPLFIRQPEIGRSRFATMVWTVDALLFYGRAYWVIRDRYAEDRRPSRFEWVPEWSAETDELGNLISAWGEPVAVRDSIRIDGPHEGLLNFAADRIREALAIDHAAANAADNPVPSIELHQTGGDALTDDQISALVTRWIAARRGSGVGYTNQSVELIPHGQPVEQLLIDGRNWAALNLARSMGLPAWAVDASVSDGSSLTYSNAPSRSRELIDYALTPYMAAIEGRLSLDDVLPGGQTVRFDTTDLLRGDFKARMDAYEVAVRAGVYTAEECRAMETGIGVGL